MAVPQRGQRRDSVDPTTWVHDHDLLSRPGIDRAHLDLFLDYATNLTLYPDVQRYFRDSRYPCSRSGDKSDPIYGPAGALAFATDLPDAEMHLVAGGHLLLESALDTVVPLIRDSSRPSSETGNWRGHPGTMPPIEGRQQACFVHSGPATHAQIGH